MRLLLILLALICLNSCVSLKPYERQYINDPDMQMGSDAGKSFRNYIFSIREGAVPADDQKASGGCGCN